MESKLLVPYQLSSTIKIKNRIVMAPMTRRMAMLDHTPIEGMVSYYMKRADAGLIITEGTIISSDAIGYGNVPGIFTNKQIEAWKKITDAVHQREGKIFLQLWHCGRVSHPHFHKGLAPISASATIMNTPLGRSGFMCGESRTATVGEIEKIIDEYAIATKNAAIANFDGVEVHGANGYLVDQFLHYCSNRREDDYGASPENMARFCLEVVHACGEVIGFDQVGLRLSPAGHMSEIITEERDQTVFKYLLHELEKKSIAYVHTGIFDDSIVYPALGGETATGFLRQNYKHNLIASGGYNFKSAEHGIDTGSFDLIAIGRPFIANPDLIKKLEAGAPLEEYMANMLERLL